MTDPYLSLAVLARDPDGAATLERCLRSAQERPDGPMFDEVVVLLGGTPNDEVRAIAARFGAVVLELPAGFPLSDGGGLADFAAARNLLYERCRGAWIGYLDCDDVVPSAERAAEVDAARGGNGHGVVVPRQTMKGFLRALPARFNSVVFGYHYAHDHLGTPIVETYREWVRWRDGFSWSNRAPGHHEALFPLPPNRRIVAELKGFFVEHRPLDDAVARRLERNDRLLAAAEHVGADGWGVRYYLARQAERLGNYEKAVEHHERCVSLAERDEEKYTSLHGLARSLRVLARHNEALTTALLAHHLAPDRGEAIADVVAVAAEMGDPVRACEWYAKLLALPPHGGQLGVEYNAYEVELWPHVVAARALSGLGRNDEAVVAAARATAFAPYDVAASRTLGEVTRAGELAAARRAARDLIGFASRRDEPRRALQLLAAIPYELESEPELASLRVQLGSLPTDDAAVRPNATVNSEVGYETSHSTDDLAVVTDPEGIDPESIGPNDPFGETNLAAVRHARRVLVAVPHGRPDGARPSAAPVYTPARLLEIVAPRARAIERLEHVPPVDVDHGSRGAVIAIYEPGPSFRVAPPTRVTIYCPEYTEQWGPFSPERAGIGGSEEMVVLVARYLASRGAEVTVYAPTPDLVVDRNCVWRPIDTFDPLFPCDVLISHRSAHLARRHELGCKRHLVWMHDAIVTRLAEDYDQERRARVDRYLTLSRWQEDQYHDRFGLPREQMLRVPNAPEPYDLVRPESERRRNAHRVIWASAPYRGLHVMTRIWPRVRAIVPDAELHVCGGWQVHDALTRIHPQLAEIKRTILEHLSDPGVVWRDRLTAGELGAELALSGVLAYPSTFPETSCRALIRAMACGCWPVYRPLAALPETAGAFGDAVGEGDVDNAAYLDLFAETIAGRLIKPPSHDFRLAMADDVRRRHDPWRRWDELVGLGVNVRDRAHAEMTT